MKKYLFILLLLIPFHSPAFAGGDEIELKDGSVLYGDVIAQNGREIYLSEKNRKPLRVEMSKIKTIRFGPRAAVPQTVADPAPSPPPLN